MSVEGLRAALSTALSAGPLLRACLPGGGTVLAAVACWPTLPGHGARQGAPAGAVSPLPGTPSATAAGGESGNDPQRISSGPSDDTSAYRAGSVDGRRRWCRPTIGSRPRAPAFLPRRRGVRGPAPNDFVRGLLRPALRPTRLLRTLRPAAALAGAAVLLFLLPSGFASRARPGSQVAAAATLVAAQRVGAAPTAAGARLSWSNPIAGSRSSNLSCPRTNTAEGSGRARFTPAPRSPSRSVGVGGRDAAWE